MPERNADGVREHLFLILEDEDAQDQHRIAAARVLLEYPKVDTKDADGLLDAIFDSLAPEQGEG